MLVYLEAEDESLDFAPKSKIQTKLRSTWNSMQKGALEHPNCLQFFKAAASVPGTAHLPLELHKDPWKRHARFKELPRDACF